MATYMKNVRSGVMIWKQWGGSFSALSCISAYNVPLMSILPAGFASLIRDVITPIGMRVATYCMLFVIRKNSIL
jgi:hypothetical protein